MSYVGMTYRRILQRKNKPLARKPAEARKLQKEIAAIMAEFEERVELDASNERPKPDKYKVPAPRPARITAPYASEAVQNRMDRRLWADKHYHPNQAVTDEVMAWWEKGRR